jgi:hypothetical protein
MPCPNDRASVTPRVGLKKIREINSHTRHLSRWRYKRPVTPWLWGTAETRWAGTPVEPLFTGSRE